MKREFSDILEECLERVRSGASLEEALAAYPEYADSLRPYILLAMEISALPIPEPAPGAVDRGWKRVSAHLRERTHATSLLGFLRIGFSHFNAWTAVKAATICLVAVLAASAMVVNVSASSLPGDNLYPVKRSWENIRLQLTSNPVERSSLQQSFDEERQQEVQTLVQTGRTAHVEFEGPVKSVQGERVQVGKLWVQLDPKTALKTEPKVGERIGVNAVVQPGGEVHANAIEQAPTLAPTSTSTFTPVPPSATFTNTPSNTVAPSETSTTVPVVEPSTTPSQPATLPTQPALETPTEVAPSTTPQPGQGPVASPTKPGKRHPTSTPTSSLATPGGVDVIPSQTVTNTPAFWPPFGTSEPTQPLFGMLTDTPTNTPTATYTQTPTDTPTATNTPTSTPTPTFTPTPTSTEASFPILPGLIPTETPYPYGTPYGPISYNPALRTTLPDRYMYIR